MPADPKERARALSTRSNMLLPGLLAWVGTVGAPAFERGVGVGPRVAACAALVAMVVGPFLTEARPWVGRAVGIHATVVLCLVTWLSLGANIGVQHLEPVRAAIGAVAWVLFAFGWGATRAPGTPEDDPRAIPGAPLPARSRLPTAAAPIFAVGLIGAALTLFAAWRVSRPSHALLSHAAAAVAAIALVTSAAKIAVDRQDYKPLTPPTARIGAAVRPLSVLAIALIVRFAWMLVE
ncbi:MAG: hypothetical protein HYZ29_10955 [Myxococcales bacterium]|nr:hypothetical protein [Myxococcales bacterium]